jgi:hypothetical protein
MPTPYGHFDDSAREYVITRPDTPLPWLNYLGQDDLFGLCTNTGGGYTFWRDAKLRRLTRYRYNNVPLDLGGRYLYVRDESGAQPVVWNPGWKPMKTALDSTTSAATGWATPASPGAGTASRSASSCSSRPARTSRCGRSASATAQQSRARCGCTRTWSSPSTRRSTT